MGSGARGIGPSPAWLGSLALLLLSAWAYPALADGRRFHDHEFREHEFRQRQYLDSRFHHDHYYPPPGHQFRALPPAPLVVISGGHHFYFSAGVWYRPVRDRYVVVAPPIGIVIPVLPPYYTRVWVGPVPYYYANNVYYVQRPEGYVVVEPPPPNPASAPGGPPVPGAVQELGPAATASPPDKEGTQGSSGRLFLYPRQGQGAEQQERDRTECAAWAAGQVPSSAANDYRRALDACLDGRGYTVR